ncbi:MAG TPA: DUF3288 family protein [Candidatus Caenarcaniphilales bacterium]
MAQQANTSDSMHKDQQHPLWGSDRQIVNRLLQEEPSDYNLAELARLWLRYTGFPGARDLQSDLEKALQRWELSEASLYEKTRQIHADGQVYKGRGNKRDDWN